MHGREVFRHAVQTLTTASQRVLETADLTIDDVDWLVPHQANRRILDAVAKRLGIAEERVLVTVDRHANTSAASIPLALAEAAGARAFAERATARDERDGWRFHLGCGARPLVAADPDLAPRRTRSTPGLRLLTEPAESARFFDCSFFEVPGR